MHYEGFSLPLRAAAFSSARFSFILANALFLQTRRRADEWFGKIWLKEDEFIKLRSGTESEYSPIPPRQKITNLLRFIGVIKEIKDTTIEPL
jgi:hypothetical protein